MRRLIRSITALMLALGGARLAAAQQVAAPTQLPPVQPLGRVFARSAQLLDAVSAVRELPGRRLLVNDISGRKVVLFDSTLATFVVVADTTSATANAYSSRAGGLVTWKGDSTLFVDPQSLSMLVIDGRGGIARVMSAPRANDINLLIGGPNGTPGTDASGRLVYRGQQGRGGRGAGGTGAAGTGRSSATSGNALPEPPAQADTAPLVRFDLRSRKMDTLAFLKVATQIVRIAQDDNGKINLLITINPLPVADDWALLADGSVAVLRARDYHVDWIRPDGTRESSPKTPFDWKRMSDDEKVAFLDSTKAAMEKLRTQAAASGDPTAIAAAMGLGGDGGRGGGGPPGGGGFPPGGPPGGGGFPGGGGGGGFVGGDLAGGGRGGGRGGDAPRGFEMQPINMVSPSDVSDYVPPFSPGAARGDMDGNLWVRTTRGVAGGSIYDVITVKGELVKRVQVPPGRVIAGFGKGGIVYMGVRESTGVRLEAAKAP